jgi:non-heme chloroperoxidase
MQQHSVTVSDGATLNVTEHGQGQPLVMIPGWSQSAAEFRHQIEAMGQSRRVLALDMRGHGESPDPGKGYRIQRLAKDLHDVLGALALQNADLLGHSMGTSIIWSYLNLFGGDAVRRLVMVDQAPAVVAQPNWDEQARLDSGAFLPDTAALAGFEAAVLASTDATATQEIVRGMFTANVSPTDLMWVASENLKLPRAHAVTLLHDHCMIDWRADIKNIRNPSLVIGAEASIFSARSQRWVASQVTDAQCEIFATNEGGSHFMFFENPTKFNAIVSAYLQ